MPESTTSPRWTFSPNRGLSPCATFTRTLRWKFFAVTNTRVRSHGTGVLRAMTTSQYPPSVSTDRLSGVTSTSSGAEGARISRI